MRDLVFKNLTSSDKKRKIISSCETMEQRGVRTNIYRHLLCRVQEVTDTSAMLPKANLYVVKKHDTRLKLEEFYCRIKGSMYMVTNSKTFLIAFVHSLRIDLKAIQHSVSS